MNNVQQLTQSIERVVENWLGGESARNAKEIVDGVARWGTARDFISDVYNDLCSKVNLFEIGVGQVRFGDLISKVPGDDFVFDKEHLRALWATGPIPPTITLDDLDEQAQSMFYAFRHHEWIVLDGKHFDAEAPQGANSVLQLPFFQRHLDHMQQEKIRQSQADRLPDHLMTWTGELSDEDLPF
jgi:hypothetical protein